MADRTAARRYAQAFLTLASETDAVVRLGEDLDEVLAACRAADGLLLRVLSNPVFTSAERRAVIDATVGQLGLDLDPFTVNLLRLLSDRGRFAILPDLIGFYHEGADDLAGRLRVEVTTAEPLTQELAAEIRGALERSTGRDVVLERQVDPALIGGIVARVGGKVYDASIRTRLASLKETLILGSSVAEA
jgi:F-type H+-transporting ATPase subunit delta